MAKITPRQALIVSVIVIMTGLVAGTVVIAWHLVEIAIMIRKAQG